MNLHELVQLPHGEATKRIKEAGKWDEDATKEVKQYTISYSLTSEQEDIVYARSLPEAIKKIKDNSDIMDIASNFVVKEIA